MFLPTEVFSTVHLNFKNSFNLNGSSIGAWMNHPPPQKNHHFHLKRPTLHVSWGRASQKPAQWASSLVVTWRAETSHGCVLKNALWLGGDPNFWTQNSRWVAVSKYFFLMFIPKIWGRWTDFDEHMFQSGWFNHLPENHCFFFTKLKFCQRAKPSCLFFWTWKEVKVAEREVDWTAPNAGFVFFFFFRRRKTAIIRFFFLGTIKWRFRPSREVWGCGVGGGNLYGWIRLAELQVCSENSDYIM